jgi:hypothetical protein
MSSYSKLIIIDLPSSILRAHSYRYVGPLCHLGVAVHVLLQLDYTSYVLVLVVFAHLL